MKRIGLGLASLLLPIVFAGAVWASAYPSRPVRFIVPFPPGGANDTIARLLAVPMTEMLKEQFVVDNRGGANTIIGTELTAQANPDGYTVLIVPASFAINVSLYKKLPYDSIRDLAPVGMIGNGAYIIVVHPSLHLTSVKELIALAKEKAGSLRFASSGIGNLTHLAAELFNMMAGTKMLHVPYKGGGPVMNDLLAGRVSVFFSTVATAAPFIRTGRLRAIAVTTAKPCSAFPNVPTVAESGLPRYDVGGWYGILAPAATPKPVVALLNTTMHRALARPELKKRLSSLGIETVQTSPEEFRRFLLSEIAKWRAVVKRLNISSAY